MQRTPLKFTKNDLAKYPFLKEATEYVRTLDLKVEDLTSLEFSRILDRAEERLEEAILYAIVSRKIKNEDVEILSFPVAMMLAVATENAFIKRRYALAEAKQAYTEMQRESAEKILQIAKNFGWDIKMEEDKFLLSFANYLQNAAYLRGKKWKLVNHSLINGSVRLTKIETARLLSEEIRRYIEKRLEEKEKPIFPEKIMKTAEKIKKLTVKKIGKAELEGFPTHVIKEAFPPCIETLYKNASSGKHLSHIGRFTLTSFLINIGMPPQNVIELFKNFPDYNERMTRYQVEHIAGERGSRTRYTPPSCDTLKVHGVCLNPDELCRKIKHPLTYYRIKAKFNRNKDVSK